MADKITSDLSANSAIYDAIRQIAFHKLVNPRNNVIKNTAKISGFVVKIHTDGELCGTVDVQEYTHTLTDKQAIDDGLPVGLHEGVYLSAIQTLYLQPIITQYFIDNKSEIWLLFLIAHSKR